jgi:DNA-binding protein YbaB
VDIAADGWSVPVAREVDEAWIEEAIDRYRQAEQRLAEFDKALATIDVTVGSPDGLVEVVVTADGTIRDVVIADAAQGCPPRELSRSVQAAVAAAADAAAWARGKLQQDMFGDYRPVPTSTEGSSR